jgi:hypothetical protein
LPHFGGLHPRGEPVGIQVLALFEELEPALLLGRDLLVGEFVQFQEINPAVVEQTLAALVPQAVTMSVTLKGAVSDQLSAFSFQLQTFLITRRITCRVGACGSKTARKMLMH